MNSTPSIDRLPSALGAAVLGALGGVLLAAFGQVITSSALGIAAAIATGVWLGLCAGRISTAVFGALCGVFAVTLGAVIGSTSFGWTLTTLACALLVGWLDWNHAPRSDAHKSPSRVGESPREKHLLTRLSHVKLAPASRVR